jgi:hypothetical protein
MAEAEGIPPTASTASTGLGIRYIGKVNRQYCYAYSGLKNAGASSAEVSFLDFTTGEGFIVGLVQFFYATDTVQDTDAIYRVKVNGLTIAQYIDTADVRQGWEGFVRVNFPPFTHVEATIAMISTAQQQAVTLTGRVYDA